MFVSVGCMNIPEVSSSKEINTEEKIQRNKQEAQNAQKAYQKLQKRRNNE